ncbi:response regulator transcription factor [Aneurinibacillus migulanus]|uniref:Response regulator n=1 Tax=Aneurinibacillus migulanus TaxID=47500 RepID=A0A0D1V425_ANEMI|nr:response regulator transcription factor [Aneurinibacillus migulanus]KIV54084.1 response regulator [Aneurinibacillus migulanus]KON97646.1 response regulator [Aneurinibacillus migulanus]MED0894396.1 response regulator transcription factor [Aneurinibacillus migulanus]MED1617006.1 response regulator transcription factor [Aneurinibacillus migulanus]SDJ36525.1 DNA-binding response regulator, OmpR family, contains REC and winged-helix (wHTH) domain [Aneurinibacillus migulanus]
MALILIVEDEMPINILINRNLELVGHECVSVYDGEAVLEIIQKYTFDLILLDIMLPKMNGYEVLEIVKEMDIPVIFLTSKSSLSDRVKGLTLGADDYIVKPFEMLELQARVEAVLRRTNKEQRSFVLNNIRIDLDGRQAFLNNELVDITPQEFDLLVALIRNRNIALSRERLLRLAWGYDFEGDTRTVDVHITKLRKKLGLDNYIKTVYKLGYRLEMLD